MPNHHDLSSLIWQIADLLRGPYHCTAFRPLEEIDAELKKAKDEIMRLLREVTA